MGGMKEHAIKPDSGSLWAYARDSYNPGIFNYLVFFRVNSILTNLLVFIITIVAVLLFIRWRTRVATQKLLDYPTPGLVTDLPQHPDGIVLFFHHPRCGPCKQVAKQIDCIVTTTPERVLKINVAEEPGLTHAFGIRATPTTLFIKNNRVNKAFVGAVSLKKLQTLLKSDV